MLTLYALMAALRRLIDGSVQKRAPTHLKNIGNSISDFLVSDSDVLPLRLRNFPLQSVNILVLRWRK